MSTGHVIHSFGTVDIMQFKRLFGMCLRDIKLTQVHLDPFF